MLLTPLINSYRFNERHSLWYLLPVIQTTDPALFAADPVVASIALFRSVFYDGLSYLVSILEISPSNLPLFLQALSIIVQAGIVGLLFAISRRLSPNLWVFTFLAAWACQQRSAIIGGDQTFTSTLTHREVAELLGLAAVYLMLCGRALQASLVLSFTVFIHVLVAIHLFVAMVPAIVFVKRRVTWPMALGVAVFAACALCYALILAPPRMDAAAQQIFLQAKADIAHVSLFAQSWLQWVEMIGLAGLVFGVWRLVGPKDDNIRLLEAFAITAAAFGIVTAILFHATSSVSVAQLQSLRSFTWVMLFTVTLLVLATSKALSTAGPTAAVLLGVLAFEILGGVLRFAFLGLGWILLAGASTRVRSMVSLESTQRFVTQAILGVCVGGAAGWLAGESLPFESLRSGWTVAVVGGLALLAVLNLQQMKLRSITVFLVLVAAITGAAGLARAQINAAQPSAEWLSVMTWTEAHTAKSDTFLTPPGVFGFRPYARRSSVNEMQPPLAWVNPVLYETLADRERTLTSVYRRASCDLDTLSALARDWNATHVIASTTCQLPDAALFATGEFRVFAVQ